MQGLLLPVIIGIIVWLGYSVPDSYVTPAVTILLILIVISISNMSGGLEGLLPALLFVISVLILIGVALNYYNNDSGNNTKELVPIVQKDNRNDLAETLKQLEEAGLITINNK